MAQLTRFDLTFSCAALGLHRDQCSRPDTCWCDCHSQEEDQ